MKQLKIANQWNTNEILVPRIMHNHLALTIGKVRTLVKSNRTVESRKNFSSTETYFKVPTKVFDT